MSHPRGSVTERPRRRLHAPRPGRQPSGGCDMAKTTDIGALIMARCDSSGGPDACWPWQGYICGQGYGQISLRPSVLRARGAHRASYLTFVGPIAKGLHLDHRCHTDDISCPGGPSCPHRSCVNPRHLEPVTPRQNAERGGWRISAHERNKTHCPHGHPYSGDNLYVEPKSGKRKCRACFVPQQAAYKRRTRHPERVSE